MDLFNTLPYPKLDKPAAWANRSYSDIVMHCFVNAVAALDKLSDTEEKRVATKKLFCGSTKRSKVNGVNSFATVAEFIRALGEPTLVVPRPGTKKPLLRFLVPEPYKAYSPIVRAKDLHGAERQEVRLAVLYEKTSRGTVEVGKFDAPNLKHVNVECVTFILDELWDGLVEWHAGELPALWPPTTDLLTHWVHLGVDLVKEKIEKDKKAFYEIHRPFGKPAVAQA